MMNVMAICTKPLARRGRYRVFEDWQFVRD